MAAFAAPAYCPPWRKLAGVAEPEAHAASTIEAAPQASGGQSAERWLSFLTSTKEAPRGSWGIARSLRCICVCRPRAPWTSVGLPALCSVDGDLNFENAG